MLIVMMLLSLFFRALAAPVISSSRGGELLTVRFEKGAVGACTVYQEQVVREEMKAFFPDGLYAPRHCGPIASSSQTVYEDDWAFIERSDPPSRWKVWSEMQWWPEGQADPSDPIASNVIEVIR